MGGQRTKADGVGPAVPRYTSKALTAPPANRQTFLRARDVLGVLGGGVCASGAAARQAQP